MIQKQIFKKMKKTYLKPETECLSVSFNAIMLSISGTNANSETPVLGKERVINFAEDNGIDE